MILPHIQPPPINAPKLLADVATFATHLIQSEDVDPIYPILKWLVQGWDTEQALWLIALYMAYYNLPSAWAVFQEYPQLGYVGEEVAAYSIATERRGLRGGKVVEYLNTYVERLRGMKQQEFLQLGWNANPVHNYYQFWETYQLLPQNGRWAAFKCGEILKKVLGWHLTAPDMRMEFCSGPKQGLQMLYGTKSESVAVLNSYGSFLWDAFKQQGVTIADWEQLETVLCNFHSLAAGKYYVGHDIDELQGKILDAPGSFDLLWQARAAVLPAAYLGEQQGWLGVSKERMKVYQQTGVVLWQE